MRWATFMLLAIPLAGAAQPRTNLQDLVRERSSRPLLEKSTAAGQAESRAGNTTPSSTELRPKLTDKTAGLALRFYFPQVGNKKDLAAQLALVAESRRLQVSQEEWGALMHAYRLFASYRMYRQEGILLEKELETLRNALRQADRGVEQNHYPRLERARLSGLYLDLLGQAEKNRRDRNAVQCELRLLLGEQADLDALADKTIPPEGQLDSTAERLLQKALRNRADYRRLQVQSQSLDTAEALARKREGFRLKYIQPEYNVEYSGDHRDLWGLSAAFVLPWGHGNPDIEAYQRQRDLLESETALRQMRIAERIRVLRENAQALADQVGIQTSETAPVLRQLEQDIDAMDSGHLEQIRDIALLRKRILDTRIQQLRAVREKELGLIALAEETGEL